MLLLLDKRDGGCFNLQVIREERLLWRWTCKAGQEGEVYSCVSFQVFQDTPT